MKTDISPAHLRFFLQDDMYLLKADQDAYRTPQTVVVTQQAPVAVQAPAVTKETPELAFNYLGSNQRNFLVLSHYPDPEFIAEAHLTALISTITRIGYSQQDIAIVNVHRYPDATWAQLTSFFNPVRLLVLGSKAIPAQLPALNQNEVQPIAGCQALYTFSFNEMVGNKENIKAFWNQIKTF